MSGLSSPNSLIDKRIGSAYPAVALVAEYIPEIKQLAELLKGVSTGLQSYVLSEMEGLISAAVLEETTVRTTENAAFASQLMSMNVRVATAESGITELNTIFVTTGLATANRILALESTVGTNKSEVTTEIETLTTNNLALATQVTALSSTVGTNKADIDLSLETLTTANLSLTEQLTSFTSITNTNYANVDSSLTTLTAADVAMATQLDSLTTMVGFNQATATTAIQTLTTADLAFAESITTLNAMVSDSAAAFVVEQDTRATEDAALAQQITNLTASVTSANAAITLEQSVRADVDTTIASQVTQLISDISLLDTDLSAAITTEATTRATADSANASSITAITARLNAGGDVANSISAALSAANTAQVTADGKASASSVSTLSTTVGGHTTNINSLTSSLNGVLGQWSVSITQAGDGTKKVSGISLLSDEVTSSFDVLADIFRVSLPDGTGSKQAFVLGNVNGVATLGLAGDMYIDGSLHSRAITTESITADRLAANSITTVKLAAGAVTADKIDSRNLTIKDAAGNVIFGAGTNVDLSRIDGLGALASKSVVGASDMSIVNLSAITANLGTITAGYARNAAGSNFVDFNATGTSWFWGANSGTAYVRADGYAVFQDAYVRGNIQATSLTVNTVNTENIVGYAISSMYETSTSGSSSISFSSSSAFSALVIGNFSASGGTEGYGQASVAISLDGVTVFSATGSLGVKNAFSKLISGSAGSHTLVFAVNGPEGFAQGSLQLLVLRR